MAKATKIEFLGETSSILFRINEKATEFLIQWLLERKGMKYLNAHHFFECNRVTS
jgi:hypothetical protein